MSYCGVLFGMNFKALGRVFGSKSSRLLAELTVQLEDDDDDLDDDESEDDEPPCPSSRDALRHMIMGEPLAHECAEAYASAMVAIYHSMGRLLDNACVAPAGLEHFQAVDRALAALAVPDPIRVSSIFFRGFPLLNLPSPEPFPVLGYLTPEEIIAAPSLSLDTSRLPREVQETVKQLEHWLDEAASQGEGLVGYYA